MENLITVLAVIGAIVFIMVVVIVCIFLYEKFIDYVWHINYARHREHFSSQVKGIAHWFSADTATMNLINNIGKMQDDLGYLDADVLRTKYQEDRAKENKVA